MARVLARQDTATVDDGERAATTKSVHTERARFFDSSNAFNLKYTEVPCHQFLTERDRALDPATGTALIPLDLSDQLETHFTASGELYYVVAGAGHSIKGADRIDWAKGDIFCLPGGGEAIHAAGHQDSVLWVITNQPALAFEHLRPAAPDDAVTEAVHYPAAEIDHQLARVREKLKGQKIAGLALIFSHGRQAASRNVLPMLTLAMN